MSDGPMHRQLFVEMTPQRQDAFVKQLQERRLLVVQKHAELVAAKQQAQDARNKKLLDDQCRMVEKDIAAAERAMDRVEARQQKIAALRAMLEQGE